MCEKLALVPGKLDHATVVAYTVGVVHCNPDDTEEDPIDILPRPVFRPAPLASPDSTRSLVSQLDEARPLNLQPSAHDHHHTDSFNTEPAGARKGRSDAFKAGSASSGRLESQRPSAEISKVGIEYSKPTPGPSKVESGISRAGSESQLLSKSSVETMKGEKVEASHATSSLSQNKENLSPNTGQVQCRPSLIETIV